MRRVVLLGLVAALIVPAMAAPSSAASQSVAARDNKFDPQKTNIEPGDTVIWTNQGSRTHNVVADDRSFKSDNLSRGESYSQTFDKEGYYYYFCSIHGARRKTGMWGLVVVGSPPASADPYANVEGKKSKRPKLVVPKEFPTIQKAVDRANPGSTVVIQPGIYKTDVVVKTHNLVIRGVDRFRTILHGEDKRNNGFLIDGAPNVTVKNLTVRNYLGNGVFYNNSNGYTVARVDAIKNRTYGIYAFDSYDGVIRDSFGWGSGDSAFYIGQCLGCSGLIENIVSQYNYLGYSGTNATGVVIRDSVFKHNGAGVVPNTLPTEEFPPNRGTLIYNNKVISNNYETVPAAGFSDSVGIPFGTGVWLAGTHNNVVRNNVIKNHNRYGVLVSQSIDPNSLPENNTVILNLIRDSGVYDLTWDGTGANNCFSNNDFKGETGPPEIETVYACANRPFAGVPWGPTQADLAASVSNVATRDQEEPPEPKRPRCQRGAPGCNR